MWNKSDLSKESQTQLEAFTTYLQDLNKYSVTFARDVPAAVINFLGYMEHVEKTPLEQADAGHLCQYIRYLRSMLKEHAEVWAKRILALPLDMFLNFLYAEGYCPGGMGEQQVKLATSPGGMGEQQVKLATSPSDPVRTA